MAQHSTARENGSEQRSTASSAWVSTAQHSTFCGVTEGPTCTWRSTAQPETMTVGQHSAAQHSTFCRVIEGVNLNMAQQSTERANFSGSAQRSLCHVHKGPHSKHFSTLSIQGSTCTWHTSQHSTARTNDSGSAQRSLHRVIEGSNSKHVSTLAVKNLTCAKQDAAQLRHRVVWLNPNDYRGWCMAWHCAYQSHLLAGTSLRKHILQDKNKCCRTKTHNAWEAHAIKC
jgi:hypothetical protein